MASRLSEDSLVHMLDSGFQALPLSGEAPVLAEFVDLEALLESKSPKKAIQKLPARALYLALLERGPEDCLDVLPLLSKRQFVKFLDYEAWQEDRISLPKAIRWLDLYRQIGPEQLYQRFRGLDEEYQLALLGPYLQVFDEEQYEAMNDQEQDALRRLPGDALFYRIVTEDPDIAGFIEDLITATSASDMEYAMSLLAHAGSLPPNEQEALILQFRLARLEEDGFVSHEESLTAFQPLNTREVLDRWGWKASASPLDRAAGEQSGSDVELLVKDDEPSAPMLRRVMAHAGREMKSEDVLVLKRSLAKMANSLCTATHVEADNAAGLRCIMEQLEAAVSMALDVLSQGDLTLATNILRHEHPKTLFRFAHSLVDTIRLEVLDGLEARQLVAASKLRDLLKHRRFGMLMNMIDQDLLETMGFEANEFLKGLFNRFPMLPAQTASLSGGPRRVMFRAVASHADLLQLNGYAVLIVAGTQVKLESFDLVAARQPKFMKTAVATRDGTDAENFSREMP